MKKVACVGILVADVIVETVNEYPEKGQLVPVNSITIHNGGNAMTASINLRKMDVETKIIGKIGNDVFGDYLKNCLDNAGVDTNGLKTDNTVQTSASVLLVDSMGERSFFHTTGSNAVFSITDIDFDVINECDFVFVTGTYLLNRFDGEETAEFLKKCKELGKVTFLDVCWDASGRWGELLNKAMPYIDFFMPSIDEAKCIAERENPDDIADVFIANGVKNVVIKMGSKGSFLKTCEQDKGKMFPIIGDVEVVDTTGAGDSFCSGFLAAFSRGKTLEECMEFGSATVFLCVTQKGATTGIRSFEETMKFLGENKKC